MHKKSEAASEPNTRWGLILLIWMAGLGAAAQFAKIAVMLDEFRGIYPVGEVSLGILISCVGAVGLVFGVLGGILLTQIGMRRAIVGGLAAACILSALQSLLLPFPAMIALRLLEGASHLAIVLSGPILMARYASQSGRSLVMTLWSTFFGVSYMLTALAAPGLLAWGGIEGVLLAHAGFMGGLAAAMWLLLPQQAVAGQAVPHGAPQITHERLSLRAIARLHRDIYASPVTSAAALGFVFYTGLYIALLTYLPGFVGAARRAPLAASLPLASIAVSFVIGVWLLRRVSPVRAVQIGFSVTALCALALIPSFGNDFAFIMAAVCLMGVTGIIPGASFAALADLNRSDEARAHASGAIAQMGNLGTTCGPPLLAAIIAASGLTGTVFFILLFCLCGIAVHAVLARRRMTLAP